MEPRYCREVIRISMIGLVTAALSAALMGCGSFLPRPAERTLFVLNGRPCEERVNTAGPTLLISDIESSVFLDSNRIVYSDAPDTRAAYQLAAWVEPLPRALGRAISKQIRCEGLFHGVEERSSVVKTDYQLTFRLDEFYHEALTSPGKVRLDLSGELVDLRSRTPVAHKSFVVEGEVSGADIGNTVAAFGRTSERFLDEMTSWLSSLKLCGKRCDDDHSR